MRLVGLIGLIILLVGCGGHSNVPPPVPLEPVRDALSVAEAWRANIGQGARRPDFQLGPMVAGDRVFFADAYGTVHARRGADGQNLWRVHMDKQVSAGVSADEELALIGTTRGKVVALDAASGERRWEAQVSSEVLAPPAVTPEGVFVRSVDGVVFALDRADGSRLWAYDSTVPSLTLRGTSQPVLAEGNLFVGFDNGRVERLDLVAGEVEWSSELAVPRGRSEIERMVDVDTTPLVRNGAVYAAAYQRRFRALSTRSGDELWTRELSVYQDPAIDEDALFVTDEESVLWALEQRSGETLWRNEQLRGRRLTAPVVHGPYIAVGDLDGYLHWLSRETGRIVARIRMDQSRVAVAPAVSGDGLLFAQSLEGAVAAFRLPGD